MGVPRPRGDLVLELDLEPYILIILEFLLQCSPQIRLGDDKSQLSFEFHSLAPAQVRKTLIRPSKKKKMFLVPAHFIF